MNCEGQWIRVVPLISNASNVLQQLISYPMIQYTEYLRRDEVLILLDAKCLRHVATPPCLDESSVGSLTVECCHSCYLRLLITVLRCDVVHYLSARLMMEV